MTLRRHAIEEVYELIDAIEAGDDHEMAEELGDLLLQVVFHCQLAQERGAFDFEKVCRHLVDKLIRRHPHVFGNLKVRNVDQVCANWDKIKKAEKHGTKRARNSLLDGIPKHLPALMREQDPVFGLAESAPVSSKSSLPIVLSSNKAPRKRTLRRYIEVKLKRIRRGIVTAWKRGMMAMLNITLALIAAGLVVELFAAATAPLGYQDENGFHLGSEKTGAPEEIHPGNPN